MHRCREEQENEALNFEQNKTYDIKTNGIKHINILIQDNKQFSITCYDDSSVMSGKDKHANTNIDITTLKMLPRSRSCWRMCVPV